MRGEDSKISSLASIDLETPPHAWRRLPAGPDGIVKMQKHLHMRGEDRLPDETPKPALRNTSTCVEKTEEGVLGGTSLRKHLHMRGEDHFHPLHRVEFREKHLHMRGEDAHLRRSKNAAQETPPHAWRRHDDGLHVVGRRGNTSTCVEKTRTLCARTDFIDGNTSTCVEKTSVPSMSKTTASRNTSTCVEKTRSAQR